MRIAIIGGGIVGIATAHALLDEGHEVSVFDREGVSAGASGGNAGWIAHMDIMPLASPKAWRNLPRWLLDPLGPLTIRPAYLPKLLPWLWRFAAASRPAQIVAGSKALIALNGGALAAWDELLGRFGAAETFLRRDGILSVWAHAADYRAADALIERQQALGLPVRRLDAAGVTSLEPALANVAAGALYESGVHVADPRLLTLKLGIWAEARGASLTIGPAAGSVGAVERRERGLGLRFRNGSLEPRVFDRVVLAAGAWSRPLAHAAGDRIPLDTERGYNITLPPRTLGLSRPVMYEGEGFVTTPLDSGDRVGGAVEFGGLHAPANMARVDAMLTRLKRFLPHTILPGPAAEAEKRWLGFRPSIPDSLPVIGESPHLPGLVYAFGHGHYGLTQAAVTGRLVADILAERPSAIDRRPYSPDRF